MRTYVQVKDYQPTDQHLEALPADGIRLYHDIYSDMAALGAYAGKVRRTGRHVLPYLQQPDDPTAPDRWQHAIEELVSTHGVNWFEIGNEPKLDDLDWFWDHFLTAADIIHDHGKKVVLAAPGYGIAESYWRLTPAAVWNASDAIAMHPYAPTPSRVLERLERGWCKLVPDLPIFVTEVGWATAGEDPSGWKVVSEELQDQYLRAVIDIVRARSEALSIRLLTWYSLRDHDSEWRRGMWDHYCGVLKEDGKRKPSWTGLKESI